ncbi:IS21 family transposase, partial [Nonomuraea fuscirosea]
HVHAFTTLGGLPTEQIRYDNLTSAVTALLFRGRRDRAENPRWLLFRSHYRFRGVLLRTGP